MTDGYFQGVPDTAGNFSEHPRFNTITSAMPNERKKRTYINISCRPNGKFVPRKLLLDSNY
jgi:hypothetical protein